MHNNGIKILLVVVMFSFILAAVASAEDATLKMLVWEGYAPDELTSQFKQLVKEKYDIDLNLEITFCAGNDEFFAVLRDGKADIISPSHNIPKDLRYKLIDMKLTLPINMENVPNYKNLLPALQKADYCTVGDEVYAVPLVRGPYGLAYNTAEFAEEPSSWDIFWDPQYAGKYALGGPDQYEHNVSMAALAAGIPVSNIWDFKSLNTPEMKEKLAALAINAHGMWEGVDDASTLKGLSFAAVWGFSLPELKALGEEWKIAEPKEGTTGWVDNFMISHTLADQPNLRRIAEEWLNFVLSDDFQVYDVRGLACAPVTTTVTAKLTPEEISRLHLDDPTHFDKNRILWKIHTKKDRNGMKRLWDGAMDKARTLNPSLGE